MRERMAVHMHPGIWSQARSHWMSVCCILAAVHVVNDINITHQMHFGSGARCISAGHLGLQDR